MILVKEMPTTGQFVAVWTGENGIWSDTYKWEGSTLYEWSLQEGWQIGDIEHLYRLQDVGFVVG